MVSKEDLTNALILYLSGMAELEGDEINVTEIIRNNNLKTTITFPFNSVDYAIAKRYYNSGELYSEWELVNGIPNGFDIGYSKSGSISWNRIWKDGKLWEHIER